MHAVLAAQHAEGVLPFDLHDRAIEADDFAGHHVEELDLPALLLGVAHVHAIEHVGPVLGFKPAGTRIDGHDGIACVGRIGEPGFDLHAIERAGQACAQLVEFDGERVILLDELESGPCVLERRAGRAIFIEGRADVARALGSRLGRLRIVPESRLRDGGVEIMQAPLVLFDMQIAACGREALGEFIERGDGFVRHLRAYRFAPWHFLNFLPLPHGQGSLRPTFA